MLSVSDIHQMPMSEIRGENTTAAPAPGASTAGAAPAGTPTPSGDTVPSNGAGPEVGAKPEATAPPEPTVQAPPPHCLYTAILRRSWSSWALRQEQLLAWRWAWVVASRQPSVRNSIARSKIFRVSGNRCHGKNQDGPCPNGRTRKRVIERRVDQNSDHPNSPD